MIEEFTPINIIGKFAHRCSLELTEFEVTITHKSCLVRCNNCRQNIFYRRMTL